MAGPRYILSSSPAFEPLPHGLWDVAEKPSVEGPHWQNGVTWEEHCDAGATTYDECIAVTGVGAQAPPAPASKTDNVTQAYRGATPFTVFTEYTCAPIGNEGVQAFAEEALLKVEAWQAERAFWTGTAGNQNTVWPHLAEDTSLSDPQGIVLQNAASQLVTGGGDIAHTLGVLEAGLADCYHGKGVIHVPMVALPTLTAESLVKDEGGTLVTAAGNKVIAGSGYTGSSPAGVAAAAGTAWIYATGPVFAFRGNVRATPLSESFDRAENTVHMLAERTYVIAYECCLLATLVTLGVPT